MRLIVDVYPNVPNGEHATGQHIIEQIERIASARGVYAHVSRDKYNGDTHIEVTKSSREFETITGLAAEYLLETAKARGISVEQLIKETVGE